jgi:hypothetical protein
MGSDWICSLKTQDEREAIIVASFDTVDAAG